MNKNKKQDKKAMSQFVWASMHVITPIAFAIVINSIIFTSGWTDRVDGDKGKKDEDPIENYLPPGWVIGTVWIFILGLLGYGAWLVRDVIHVYVMFVFVMVYCLLYPFYTAGLQQSIGRYMNAVAFFLSLILLFWVLGFARRVGVLLCVAPLVAWVGYVNIVQLFTLRI